MLTCKMKSKIILKNIRQKLIIRRILKSEKIEAESFIPKKIELKMMLNQKNMKKV